HTLDRWWRRDGQRWHGIRLSRHLEKLARFDVLRIFLQKRFEVADRLDLLSHAQEPDPTLKQAPYAGLPSRPGIPGCRVRLGARHGAGHIAEQPVVLELEDELVEALEVDRDLEAPAVVEHLRDATLAIEHSNDRQLELVELEVLSARRIDHLDPTR